VNIPDTGDLTDAVKAALLGPAAVVALHVGVGEKPLGVPDDSKTGWLVLYPSGPEGSVGPIGDPYADTPSEIQVTTVAWTAEQAVFLDGVARHVMLPGTATISVPGRVVTFVERVAGQPATRDDKVSPPQWTFMSVYRISTTPA
jgi:hypothetical protein